MSSGLRWPKFRFGLLRFFKNELNRNLFVKFVKPYLTVNHGVLWNRILVRFHSVSVELFHFVSLFRDENYQLNADDKQVYLDADGAFGSARSARRCSIDYTGICQSHHWLMCFASSAIRLFPELICQKLPMFTAVYAWPLLMWVTSYTPLCEMFGVFRMTAHASAC